MVVVTRREFIGKPVKRTAENARVHVIHFGRRITQVSVIERGQRGGRTSVGVQLDRATARELADELMAPEGAAWSFADPARAALELIDRDGCIDLDAREMRCCEPGARDGDGAPLARESWCHPCVARDALDRTSVRLE